jgi:uncharacterized Fe-S radical SAM superfamily protein PflX
MSVDLTSRLTDMALAAIEREFGPCDICEDRPGVRKVEPSGICVCDECDQVEFRNMHRLPRFRNRDERDAYMAGSKTHGEI